MDMDSYRDVFIEETRENINALNKALLEFEKNVEDLTPINELFRAAHTLKGMSATMGYDKFAGFTHSLEEVLDAIRSGKIRASVEVVNILFRSIDTLEDFLENISEHNADMSQNAEKLRADISRHLTGGIAEEVVVKPAVKEEKPSQNDIEIDEFIIKEAAAGGLNVFSLLINISKECAFKNVRAFMSVRNLSEKGDIVKSVPSSKDIEEGKIGDSFQLGYVTSLGEDDVRDIVMKIAEIESVRINSLVKSEEFIEAAHKEVAAVQQEASKEVTFEKKDKKAAVAQSVRVNVEKLDALMNLVGELVITKIRLDQISKDKKYEMLKETVEEFDRVIDELQIEVTGVRMLPVSNIFDRYPRVIRDLASQAGKQVETVIEGGDIEIDRTVLEEINEPMLHLIRNSIAHGVEKPDVREKAGKSPKGIIRLIARRERNSVMIEVSDDGKGLDTSVIRKKIVEKGILAEERLKGMTEDEIASLIAIPGFSTAENVDSVSGRGVGVDVVKTKVEAFGGIFKIENYPGEGIKFLLKLPLTLAIIQALLVKASGETYALPVIHTIETLELKKEEIKTIQDRRVIVLREEVIPVLNLAELLGREKEDAETVELVIAEVRDKKIALEVEKVMGQQEVAIKSLGDFLKFAKGFSGVTILGNGKISLIVDIPSLV